MLGKSSGIDAATLVMSSETDFRKTFDLTQIPIILAAYMKGIQAAFHLAVVASSLATVVSLGSR